MTVTEKTFAPLAGAGLGAKAQLVPFLMVGDPSLEATERLATVLIEEGAGALELGVPFSDALADGPVIQLAAARALQNKVTLEDVLALGARISRRHPHVSLIVFSYFNPLLSYGLDRYARAAREAGLHATLTVDLPPEEAKDYIEAHKRYDLKTVFLASPTTSDARLAQIAAASTGFIYMVSRTGVTGTHGQFSTRLAADVARVRKTTRLPLAVGFGISKAEHAREVSRLAEGVVVGSAFVKLVEEHKDLAKLEAAMRNLARDLTAGIRSP